MANDVSRVPSILYDIQTSSTENALKSLSILNEIISTREEEMEFLYKIGGFHLLINSMKNNAEFVNVCLKIFANACRKHERVRKELIKANIFYLLGNRLRNECDFSQGSMVLYSALLVILVKGNENAQNQMKISGCLSSLVRILNRILEETEHKEVPLRNLEIIIYALTACIKEPRHPGNQTEVGWTTTKVNESSILDYLGKRTIFEDEAQLQVVRCLWSLLRSLLNGHEVNQKIFINYEGYRVLFRSMQEILDEGKHDVMSDLLSKMTGFLVKLKCHKKFLYQASGYCSVMILKGLLKSIDSSILQHIVTFLDSLTQEVPEVLYIIKDKEVVKAMEKAKEVLSRSTASVSLRQDIWARMGLESADPSPNPTSNDVMSDFNFYQRPQNSFCPLHDENYKQVQDYSGFLTQKLNRHERLDVCLICDKKKKARKMNKSSLVLPRRNRSGFNVMRFMRRVIFGIFPQFWTWLKGPSNDLKPNSSDPLDHEYLIVNNQLYYFYKGLPFKIQDNQ